MRVPEHSRPCLRRLVAGGLVGVVLGDVGEHRATAGGVFHVARAHLAEESLGLGPARDLLGPDTRSGRSRETYFWRPCLFLNAASFWVAGD